MKKNGQKFQEGTRKYEKGKLGKKYMCGRVEGAQTCCAILVVSANERTLFRGTIGRSSYSVVSELSLTCTVSSSLITIHVG